MERLTLEVPTYNAVRFPREVARGDKPEFGPPNVPVVIHGAGGVKIVLGTTDERDTSKPDMQIERHPNGWMIFLHPLGESDPSAYVYFCDNGKSYIQAGRCGGPTEPIALLSPTEPIPHFSATDSAD